MKTQTLSHDSRFSLYTITFLLALAAALTVGCAKKSRVDEAAASQNTEKKLAGDEIPAGSRPTLDEHGRVRATGVARNPGEGDALVPDILFAFDSADLSAAGKKTLDEAAKILTKNGTWTLIVEGHCDERGTEDYNLALGQRRANAAANYLRSRGIEAERLDTVSFGEAYPVDPASTEDAWAKNRRAHLGFQPPPAVSTAE